MDVPAQTIVDLGADCNRSENDGWTALHFAASSGFDEIVEILLKVGTYLSLIISVVVNSRIGSM